MYSLICQMTQRKKQVRPSTCVRRQSIKELIVASFESLENLVMKRMRRRCKIRHRFQCRNGRERKPKLGYVFVHVVKVHFLRYRSDASSIRQVSLSRRPVFPYCPIRRSRDDSKGTPMIMMLVMLLSLWNSRSDEGLMHVLVLCCKLANFLFEGQVAFGAAHRRSEASGEGVEAGV